MTTVLLTTATHHLDPPMAMSRAMGMVVMRDTLATLGMVITTTATWLKKENILHIHQEIPISRRVPKRREIETTNPLEISIQMSDPRRRNVSKTVRGRKITMKDVNRRRKVGLVA